MRHAALLTAAVLGGCLFLFGRSCFGGFFVVDHTYGMVVYALARALRRSLPGAALAAVGVILAGGILAVQWISTAGLVSVTGAPVAEEQDLLEFAPAGRTIGVPVSLLSLTICLGALALALRRNRPSPS